MCKITHEVAITWVAGDETNMQCHLRSQKGKIAGPDGDLAIPVITRIQVEQAQGWPPVSI